MLVIMVSVLRMDALTMTAIEPVAAMPPDVAVQLNVYVTEPGAVGTTVIDPVAGWVPLNVPPIALDMLAVHDETLVDVQDNLTERPKLMIEPGVGEVNVTDAEAAGGALAPML